MMATASMAWAAQTTTPEIIITLLDDVVTIAATGEGEVHLYVDGVEVDNPVEIARGEEDVEVTVTATAQAEGQLISETIMEEVTIPAIENAYTVDPHLDGWWIVLINKNGEEVWYNLSYWYDSYMTTIPVGADYGTSYSQAHYRFVVDGIVYGAPEEDMATVLGDAMMNPLLAESEDFYTIPVGYYYSIGVAMPETGDLYVYCAQGPQIPIATPLQGDVDDDGRVSIDDVTSLINILLSGNNSSDNADVNSDGRVSIDDVTALINYLLSGTW